MNRLLVINIFRFFALVFLQVFVLDNIQFLGFLNPYLYILFILLLPLETPRWLLLVSAFFLGLFIDVFSHTPGINAAASVLTAFIRPGLIQLMLPNKEIESGKAINIRNFGFTWFFVYSSYLVLIHHLSLFYLEIFRLSEFFDTLKRAVLSAAFTLVFILLSQYLFYSSKK